MLLPVSENGILATCRLLVESPVNQKTLTERYTIEAQRFIQQNRDRPFFLYLPHTMPHAPWAASEEFGGKSKHGTYGDAVEELDWSTGKILRALRETEVDRNTLVIFTSEDGAWVGGKRAGGGSNGLFRGGRFTAWEGGCRMPFPARWPGRITAGAVRSDIARTMDLFTTAVALAKGKPPADRAIDGFNKASVLDGAGDSPRTDLYCFTCPLTSKFQLAAVRSSSKADNFGDRLRNLGIPPRRS